MERRKLNQSELARRLGTTQSAVSGWVREGKLPEGKLMLLLPEILQVSGHWLLTGQGSFDVPETPPSEAAAYTMGFQLACTYLSRHAEHTGALGELGIFPVDSATVDANVDLLGKKLRSTSGAPDAVTDATLDATEVGREGVRAAHHPRQRPTKKAPRRRAAGD